MSMKEKIDEVIASAIVNRAPFISTYASLKGLGLVTYKVNTKNLEMIYKWEKGEYNKTPSNAHDFEIANKFLEKGIKDAIDFHNENNTSYYDFIEAIVKKGCASYVVNFTKNEVTYYGKTKSEFYTEKVRGF